MLKLITFYLNLLDFFFQNVLYTRKSAQIVINNENAYIYFSAHSVFLEKPASGKLIFNIFESQTIIKNSLGANKPKGIIDDSQYRLRTAKSEKNLPVF